MITSDDLYVGAMFICVKSDGFLQTYQQGKVYEISKVVSTGAVMCDDNGARHVMSLQVLNNDAFPSFLPMSRLSKQDLFLFEMCGKLPDIYKI